MLDHVVNQTMNFLENMPKSKRKKKGQFFTSVETARFMADMFDLDNCKGRISVLDPGAGTGILSVAFLERLMSLSSDINVSLTCYETDPEVLAVQLNVFPENARAKRCYEGVGFTERHNTPDAFKYKDESWGRCNMIIKRSIPVL